MRYAREGSDQVQLWDLSKLSRASAYLQGCEQKKASGYPQLRIMRGLNMWSISNLLQRGPPTWGRNLVAVQQQRWIVLTVCKTAVTCLSMMGSTKYSSDICPEWAVQNMCYMFVDKSRWVWKWSLNVHVMRPPGVCLFNFRQTNHYFLFITFTLIPVRSLDVFAPFCQIPNRTLCQWDWSYYDHKGCHFHTVNTHIEVRAV